MNSHAKSLRSAVHKEIDLAAGPSADEYPLLDRFDKVGQLLAQYVPKFTHTTLSPARAYHRHCRYRQLCVTTVWTDWKYASEVEDALWLTHVRAIRAYRQVTKDTLSGPQLAVIRNKVTRHHQNFLKISQEFYRGYLQRAAARYNTLPELQRALRGAALSEIDVPETERVDAAAANIEKLVTASAYRTLVYLGDLARYRTLIRPEKDRNYDSALAYYGLANDVDPTSGLAYHQMAVILREQSRHLEVVYSLYRGLVAEHPHPQASKNLGVVFKDLLRTTPPRAPKAHEALQFWFSRLHAHFDRGKVFSQHNELEKEVLGRFDMAVKAHDFGEGLLKLILVNICAYEVTSNKVKGISLPMCSLRGPSTNFTTAEWTEEASRSCQFIMRLNIQMILMISDHVETELTDLIDSMRNPDDQANGTNLNGVSNTARANKFSPVLEAALPLLRVYMTWLCMYRSQIVDYQAHLVPYLPNMYKTLSRALTRFIELMELLQLQHDYQFKTVNFLFTEDTMTLGLKTLHGPELSPNCQLSVDSMHGQPKPRFEEDSKLVIKSDDITYTRALDITYRAFVLTRDAKFPFALSPDGSAVVYLEEGKPAPVVGTSNGHVVSNGPATSNGLATSNGPVPGHQRQLSDKAAEMVAALGLTQSSDGLRLIPKQAAPQQPSPQQSTPKAPTPKQPALKEPIPKQQTPTVADVRVTPAQTPVGKPARQTVNSAAAPIKPIRQPYNPPSGQLETNFRRHRHHPSNVKAVTPPQVPAESDNSMDESHVYDIVKDFLEPREPQEQQQGPDETSYGMHTDTANQLFGSGLASSPALPPAIAPGSENRLSAQWERPTATSGNGWVNPTLTWYGMSSAGPQNAWPTTPGSAGRGMTNGATSNGYYGHAANNSGGYPSSGNLAPGTHWGQNSRESGPPAQLDPWRQAGQPRQTTPRFGANGMGPIKSLDDALAAQLASLIPNRSSFSPATHVSTPHAAHNNLPVPGSFGSTEFAFSQNSSRPQVNSPWGLGNNQNGGYQGGTATGGLPPPPGFGRPGSSLRTAESSNAMDQTQQNGQNGYSYDQYYNNAFK
jgi:protein SMG7